MPGHRETAASPTHDIQLTVPRKSLFILGLIVTSSALLGALMLTRDHGWRDDFAAYIM